MKQLLCILLLICSPPAEHAARPAPPAQPATGPGGADYAYEKVRVSKYGHGVKQYWIFEPKGANKPLPVIVFLHGWSAFHPMTYEGWINHMVRRGNIVIYPRWQKSLSTPPQNATGHAIIAVQKAFKKLGKKGHATPDADKFALIGTSMGGIIAANMAVLASQHNLPAIKALMIAQPGNTWKKPKGSRSYISLMDLKDIPKETLMQVVVNNQDDVAGSIDAKRIFRKSTGVPPENKNYIVVRSDGHGRPALIAHHGAVSAPSEPFKKWPSHVSATDALDYFAYWKLFDALTDAAFYGKNRDIALGDTEAQRNMGTWSDGRPVKPLKVIANP